MATGGGMIPVILVFMVFGLAFASLILAVILRAACALFNKISGAKKAARADDDDDEEVTSSKRKRRARETQLAPADNPYHAPEADDDEADRIALRLQKKGVIEPSFGRAFLIAMVANFFTMALNLIIVIAFYAATKDSVEQSARYQILQSSIHFTVLWLVLMIMLRTSAARSFLVTLIMYVILILIIVPFVAAMMLITLR